MAQTKKIQLCPVCSAIPEALYEIDRFTPPFRILKCPECGLEMQAKIPRHPDHYGQEYYTGQAEYSYRDERKLSEFDAHVFRARLKTISRFVPPPARFLDVGCAFGGFVEAASKQGYAASGLDVSAYAVEDARSRGLDIHLGELGSDPFAEESFDIITLIEVMEHLTEPRKAAERLSQLLKPGGLLVIQTANFLGRQAKKAGSGYHYYLPGHYFYYSHKNLSCLLGDYGLKTVRIYRPTDFGLLPKLRKSRGSFRGPLDYLAWLRIARYHYLSKLHWKDASWTSAMVLYARKPSEVPVKLRGREGLTLKSGLPAYPAPCRSVPRDARF